MKKILALVLVLVSLLSCTAMATEYSYKEYTYDPALLEGSAGSWAQLEALGLQFFLPDIFLPVEVTEDQAAQGCIANFATTDLSGAISIGYSVAADLEGNAITTLEDLAALYTAVGAASVDIYFVNGLPVVTYFLAEQNVLGYAVLFEDATQCAISFAPAADAGMATLAGIVISTLQVIA